MAFSDSPSLKDYENGLPHQPIDSARRKRITYFMIGILALFVAALGFYNIVSSQDMALLTGKGSVSGQVVDENGQGLATVVYVFGVDKPVKTDANGFFVYENIPAGERILVITHNGYAADYPIHVTAGQTVELGALTFKIVTPAVEE